MFIRHVDRLLTRYCDGELSAAERQRVDAHLATCGRCRAALDEIQFSARLVRQLTAVSAPPAVWRNIEAALTEPERTSPAHVTLQWASACALVLAVATGAYWWTRDSSAGPWEVAQTKDGVSRRMASGEWVETEDGSQVRIIVGELGTVDVAPGSRVRLGEVRGSEYRMALT